MTQPQSPLSYVSVETLTEIAEKHDTPVYVYDAKAIRENLAAYQQALANRKHQVCYAVKANANLAVLKLLAEAGAGFDIVSVGELQRVLLAGGDAKKTIFSGVGKQVEEIAFALDVGIEAFDVESEQELQTIIDIAAEMDCIAPISIRYNPDVDAKTHPYISTGLKESKFGLTEDRAFFAYQTAQQNPHIEVVGINMHIGSQITALSAFTDALKAQSRFVKHLGDELGIQLKHINVGGGIGVRYRDETPIAISDWAAVIKAAYPDNDVTLLMEPGRSIVAGAGTLLTRVINTKTQSGNHFTVVDAAMNDYARVALYQSYNEISNLSPGQNAPVSQAIVGPVCESGDSFASERLLSAAPQDLLAIHDTGAYGFVMASNYNTRNRPPEVLVEGEDAQLVRRREMFEDQVAAELIGDMALEADAEE